MSWLNQFNSLTGKLTDFTKEVLSEDASNYADKDVSHQNGALSSQEMGKMCCVEKEKKITQLIQEKEQLECNIEELEQMHQEAIDSLLELKNQAISENNLLQKQLAQQEEKLASSMQLCEVELLKKDLQKMLDDRTDQKSETFRCDDKISLITFLQLFSKNYTREILESNIDRLESEKHVLKCNASERDKDTINREIHKMDNYINFLQTFSVNFDSILPVVSEMSTAFRFLVSEVVNLNTKLSASDSEVSCDINRESSDNCRNFDVGYVKLNKESCESASQTESLAIDAGSQTDEKISKAFKDSQTESDIFSQNDMLGESLEYQFKKSINDSTQTDESSPNCINSEVKDAELKTSNFESASQTDLNVGTDASTQTQRSSNNYINYESKDSQTEMNQFAQIEMIDKFHESLNNSTQHSTQTDKCSCQCESLKSELTESRKLMNDFELELKSHQKEHLDILNDVKHKLQLSQDKMIEKDAIIQSQKKEFLILRGKLKDSNQNIKLLQSKITESNDRNSPLKDMNDIRQKLPSEDKNIELDIIQSQKKEILILKDKLKDSNQQLKLLQNQTSQSIDSRSGKNTANLTLQVSTGTDRQEVASLRDKVSNLELEKQKIICVLNEKTQECSSLKAEVHKLTNIVASEKKALLKLQQDNCELKCSTDTKSDPELTKETVKKLSNIIRDKDLEVESLEQKNSTLMLLLQEASNVPEHVQSLLEEKENLSKQISLLKADHEQILQNYSKKDKECGEYLAELKDLRSAFEVQRENFDVLERKHMTVARQYEDKQKSLIDTQNEMVVLKTRVSDLERQQVDIKEKYSELLNKINADGLVQITHDELSEQHARIDKLTCANEEKDHLIQEKDCMIHELSQQTKKMRLEIEQHQQAMQVLDKKLSDFGVKISEMKDTIEVLEKDKSLVEQKLQDKVAEAALLRDMNERLNMALNEKEFAMQSMTEKVHSLSQFISSDSSGKMDINQILADSEAMFSRAQDLYRERDETLLALNQIKQENQNLRNEIQRAKSTEIHQKNELDRLRQHLIEIEENYTSEALRAEKREKLLKDELIEVKRRAEITSTAVVDTNQRASIQIASLQEQLSILVSQRDEALSQASTLEDKVLQHSTAVGKLQLLLEQMQKGNERKLKEAEKKWQVILERQQGACTQLEKKLMEKQRQLDESSEALEAASRLSEQLDAKETIIENLKSELFKIENKIKSTSQEMDTIKSNTEGKVDRVVMKSLVLGYFSTPPGQKSEVIRLLARVLDFNQEEMEKAGIMVGTHTKRPENKGLFSSIFNRLPSLSSDEQIQLQPDKSFSTLFVQFLENESRPIVPMPFPIEKMTQELVEKGPKNQQLSLNKSSPTRKSPLLMDMDVAFPTFMPVPSTDYPNQPSASAILKEVLD